MARAAGIAGVLLAGCAAGARRSTPPPPILTPQRSGTSVRLIGLDPVDERVAWVAGTGGAWARTIDGGETWEAGVVPGADSLQFRDVHAVDAETAYLLSIGSGAASRVYRTDDGGATWRLLFQNDDPDAFFDCFDFWSPERGIAFSDAVDGEFVLIATDDGGRTWRRTPVDRLPDASAGEGSFAASGTCLLARGESAAWFGTGAGASARVFRTDDGGRSWTAAATPIAGGTSTTGIASLAFLDDRRGAAFGGDVAAPAEPTASVATTTDGGATWRLAGRPDRPGAVYGGAFVPGAPTPTLVAVGPSGMALSRDFGTTWTTIDTLDHWSVAFGGPGVGWAVGSGGRITRIDVPGPGR